MRILAALRWTCGVVVAALAVGNAAADPVRIGLAVDSVDYAPIAAARQLGYFAKAGLDVRMITFRGGAAAQEALSAGAVDLIGYFAPAVGLAVSKGAREKMVATIVAGHVGWHAIVKADSPVRTLQDLAGKKIGITLKATTSDMAVLWLGEQAGVKFQEIPLGGGGTLPALRMGQIDAIVVNLYSSPMTMREVMSGRARSIYDLTDRMPPTLSHVYVASQQMIDRRPQELRATLAAIFQALGYMRGHRDWSLAFLKTYIRSDDDKLIAAFYDHVAHELSPDGRIEAAWIRNGLGLAARAWQMDALAKVDPASLFTNDFLPAGK